MTLEQALSRSICTRLTGVTGLGSIRIVPANDDTEITTVPRITVSATRGSESIVGYQIYATQVEIRITANAFPAASISQVSGNASVETLFSKVETSLTSNVTTLSNANIVVLGALYDGSVSDDRSDRTITRRWTLTIHAGSL
jgi:UDP-N-acetyl-D-mannosaminuronate dehydrogenase